jgi:pyruvate formate lyase activating enzyme
MSAFDCSMKAQGRLPGSCSVRANGKQMPACQATLKHDHGSVHRRISAVHLSRPENYLSIYQSGCNFSCRKCHSWYFSKIGQGDWYSPENILREAVAYEKRVTLVEPREKTTAWHAHDTCRCCGSCVRHGERSKTCPGILPVESIQSSPQGYGPARNIVAFTGGDVTCRPVFYGECARLIKRDTQLRVLIETNGYGLTPKNLDYLKDAGVDAFWLDIKAYEGATHQWLTGCPNDEILKLPDQIIGRNFVLEVLSLYIPGVVETDQLEQIARLLVRLDPNIVFTLLAFFPEYRMKDVPPPTVATIVDAYQRIKATGLKNIRLGNLGVFLRSEMDQLFFMAHVDPGDF